MTSPQKIEEVVHPSSFRLEVLFYWWVPDSTFIQMQPHQVGLKSSGLKIRGSLGSQILLAVKLLEDS